MGTVTIGLSEVNDGGHRATTAGTLVQGSDGHKNRSIINGACDDTADRGLDMTMMVDVRIVKRNLAPTPQLGGWVRFTLHEDVDNFAVEVFCASAVWDVKTGGTNGPIDPLHVQCVLHDIVTDAITATCSGHIPNDDRLCLIELNTRGA